LARSRKRSHR